MYAQTTVYIVRLIEEEILTRRSNMRVRHARVDYATWLQISNLKIIIETESCGGAHRLMARWRWL